MKKLFFLTFFIFLLIGCGDMTKEEKNILKRHVEITEQAYLEDYQYLTGDCQFISTDYETMMDKLKNDTFILYVGGSWCPNCQAIAKFMNDAANECGMQIYNFDTRIGTIKDGEHDIRNCYTAPEKSLYQKFITASQFVNPNGNKTENTDIDRMSVPTVLAYKDGKLIDYIAKEYLYDGTILYDMRDMDAEIKEDLSEVFYQDLITLFKNIC